MGRHVCNAAYYIRDHFYSGDDPEARDFLMMNGSYDSEDALRCLPLPLPLPLLHCPTLPRIPWSPGLLFLPCRCRVPTHLHRFFLLACPFHTRSPDVCACVCVCARVRLPMFPFVSSDHESADELDIEVDPADHSQGVP